MEDCNQHYGLYRAVFKLVAGEKCELTDLRNQGNKSQEIREHILEIAELFIGYFTSPLRKIHENFLTCEITELLEIWHHLGFKPFISA